MSQALRHVGKETPRIAANNFVTGRAKYAQDLKIPNMLHGKILRSPYPHANITSIDTSKAEALTGVKAVLTYQNCPDWYVSHLGDSPPTHERILDNKVRYVGAPVALIAAVTIEIAEEAMDLIDVTYEELTPVYDMEEAIKPGAPQLYEQLPNNIVPCNYMPVDMELGDLDKGFAEADVIVEVTSSVINAQNPLPPESPGVIASWEGTMLTLNGTIMNPTQCTIWVAPATNTHPSDVKIISPFVGGGYGEKHMAGNIGIILYAAALAKVTNKPVGVFYTKEEHFAAFQIRMPCKAQYKLGMKKDGTVTAIEGHQLSDAGAFASLQEFMNAVGMIVLANLVKCENIKYDNQIVVTNKSASGAYRGFGYMESTSLVSRVLEMAMEKIDIDPVEYYKKNVLNAGEEYYHFYMYKRYETCQGPDMSRVVEEGAKKFNWSERWKGWNKPTSVNGSKRTGVGIGVSGHTDCGERDSNASVQLNAEGSAMVYTICSEIGTGGKDLVRKMVAEVLNIPLELTYITPSDSTVNPREWGASGSRATLATGSASVNAAQNALQKLFEKAAPMFETTPDALATEDFFVFLKDAPDGKRLSWMEIIGFTNDIIAGGHFNERYDVNCFQIHFVEVEVDTETGATEIVDHLSCCDVGQIVNPLAVKGQLDGFFPGVGIALTEETVWDVPTGRMMSANMIDYKTRTFNEIPKHDSVILENPPQMDPPAPFGAIGVGEPSLSPSAPAVSMAIHNAIGKQFVEYPITPAKILEALAEGGKN